MRCFRMLYSTLDFVIVVTIILLFVLIFSLYKIFNFF